MSVALRHPGRGHREPRAVLTTVDYEPAIPTISGVLRVRFLRLRSVAAFSFVLLLGMAALGVVAVVLAWHLAVRWGTVEDAETLLVGLGFETFELRPGPLLEVVFVLAAGAVVVGTILAVVAAFLFNVVSWVTGGIAVTTRERRASDRIDGDSTDERTSRGGGI